MNGFIDMRTILRRPLESLPGQITIHENLMRWRKWCAIIGSEDTFIIIILDSRCKCVCVCFGGKGVGDGDSSVGTALDSQSGCPGFESSLELSFGGFDVIKSNQPFPHV